MQYAKNVIIIQSGGPSNQFELSDHRKSHFRPHQKHRTWSILHSCGGAHPPFRSRSTRLRSRSILVNNSFRLSIFNFRNNLFFFSGVVETDSAAGTIVIRLLAIVSGPVTAGDVTYFIEHEPSDKLAVINGTEDNLLDWFKVDSRTGVVRLLKEPANSWAVTGGNVTFMVGARDASRSMQARASVAVIIHGLTRNFEC